MKSRSFLYVCLFASVFCSCVENKGQNDGKDSATAEQQATEHRMKEYNLTDSVTLGSHLFVYTIHREADDSLKVVVDENGDKFVDNYYDLTMNGILDGFRFMSAKEGKLTFGVCVSFPESDMLTPFVLTIGPDGSYTLEPDTAPDIEEEDTSV